MSVIQNIADACDKMGEVDMGGLTLEGADPSLLDPTHMDLDRHVAIQPSAIAYYGALLKEAARRQKNLKQAHKRWHARKYAEAKVSLGEAKPTINDIEARLMADNEAEIENWDKQLARAEMEFDTLDAWYEAWRQKSFSIREHVQIDEDERWNQSDSVSDDGLSRKTQGTRSVIDRYRKRKEAQGDEQGV